MDLPSSAALERLADRGWPALEREALQGWTLRASAGVTNRANSVLTAGDVDDIPSAVTHAERWYAARSLPPVFQLPHPATPVVFRPPTGESARRTQGLLAGELRARGYVEESVTDVLVGERGRVASAVPAAAAPAAAGVRVHVEGAPSEGWLDTWWSVDGRGGAAEREVARRILTGGPALYASAGDPAAPDAVARLALVGGWGGLYAVATRPEARRRGLARSLAQALAHAAADHGVTALWLQVLAANAAAQSLYASLGFTRASGYSYWSRASAEGR